MQPWPGERLNGEPPPGVCLHSNRRLHLNKADMDGGTRCQSFRSGACHTQRLNSVNWADKHGLCPADKFEKRGFKTTGLWADAAAATTRPFHGTVNLKSTVR